MATYLHPGVYMEEIPGGAKPIEAVSTSTAAFIGFATKGPIGEPILIGKWDDYLNLFGGLQDRSNDMKVDEMGFTIFGFFQNGGSKAYIVRLAKNAVKAMGLMDHPDPLNVSKALQFTAINEGAWANGLVVKINPRQGNPSYEVAIGKKDQKGNLKTIMEQFTVNLNPDDAYYLTKVINGHSRLLEKVEIVDIDETKIPAAYFLGTSESAGLELGGDGFNFSELEEAERLLNLRIDGVAVPVPLPAVDYRGNLAKLAMDIQSIVRNGDNLPDARKNFTCEAAGNNKLKLTSGSRNKTAVVAVEDSGLAPTLKLGAAHGGKELTGIQTANEMLSDTEATLVGGSDGADTFVANDYMSVFSKFEKIRDISIICLPGQQWSASGNDIIDSAIAHAEKMKNRMIIIDPPAAKELKTETDVTGLSLPTSTYTALYYPWLVYKNPFYDETNPGKDQTLTVPPSGCAAGMWAKIDGTRGIWKAPAGVETNLLGAAGLKYVVEDGEQDILNPLGVNCLRTIPGYGRVIWGTRTLATKANPEWRYVSVRRTAIFIEQSIYNGIQWAVFEPNNHCLWASLRANIGAFMNGLYRSGAFQGETASQSYFVRCNLGDTMTQDDIDRGMVIVVVGFAPLKPAEFVIIRIQQKVGQS